MKAQKERTNTNTAILTYRYIWYTRGKCQNVQWFLKSTGTHHVPLLSIKGVSHWFDTSSRHLMIILGIKRRVKQLFLFQPPRKVKLPKHRGFLSLIHQKSMSLLRICIELSDYDRLLKEK